VSGAAGDARRGAAWPDVAATSRIVWPLVLWRATSEHPDLGAVRGRGLSHAAALRSLARQVRRRTARPASLGGRAPRSGTQDPPVAAEERGEGP